MNKNKVTQAKMKILDWIIFAILFVVLFTTFWFIIPNVDHALKVSLNMDSKYPYGANLNNWFKGQGYLAQTLDTLTNTLSIIASFWMFKRFKKQWILWIIINVLQFTMYVGLNGWGINIPMLIMWGVYLVNAAYAYWLWNKNQKRKKSALLIIDMQNDFINGSLAIKESEKLIPFINKRMNEFKYVIASLDWHPKKHISFESSGGQWPKHCVRNTNGAKLHKKLNIKNINEFIYKGQNQDKEEYSAFNAMNKNNDNLETILKKQYIKDIYVVGITLDYCVKSTIYDLIEKNFNVYLFQDGTKAINNPTKLFDEIKKTKIKII